MQNAINQGVEKLNIDDFQFLGLFPEVDKEATIKNCKYHLTRILPKMIRASGESINQLRSPSMDGMPRPSSISNNADITIVRRVYAQQVVKRTIEAISHCDEKSKEVLDMLYLQNYTDTMCYMSIGYSRGHYFDHVKPAALLQFADAYLLDDLHIYKEDRDGQD